VATDREWADGFLAQARADLAAADCVAASGAASSTLAMLLQMGFEKPAKAALLRTRSASLDFVTGTHATAGRVLLILRRERRRFEPLGGVKAWGDVLWFIEELERAHPQLKPGRAEAKLELPWENVDGAIQWPERDLAVAKSLGDPRSVLKHRVLRFAALFAARFDQLFP
jgi:hypothetical protein